MSHHNHDANQERRRFARIAESSKVRLSFADPASVTVEAELVESSQSGFRVAHGCKELVPGLELELLREDRPAQKGRVVWTHLLDGRRVSGCLLL